MSSKRQQRFLSSHLVPAADADDSKVDIEKVPMRVPGSMPRPQPSLAPGPSMMDACCEDAEWAIAIRDSYKFHLPVVTMTREDLDALVASRQMYF